jgi:hypothetical protein
MSLSVQTGINLHNSKPSAMKIRFQVSKITHADPQVIKGIIQLKLKDSEYVILEAPNNSIKFDDNPWILRWNHQQVRRLDGGIFEIDNTSITLKYYLNLWQPLIGASIPVIGTIIAGAYKGTMFFIAFIFIALCIQTVISRNVAKDMLTSIINEAEIGLTGI